MVSRNSMNLVDVMQIIRRNCPLQPSPNLDLLKDAVEEYGTSNFLQEVFPVILETSRVHDFQLLVRKLTRAETEVSLKRTEIACLLANAFLCNIPIESKWDPTDINFHRLYDKSARDSTTRKEKIKCILTYFTHFKHTQGGECPQGSVTYRKNVVTSTPHWETSFRMLNSFIAVPNLSISQGFRFLQVIFSNKHIGGGVLGQGTLQEEIRFITCPEMIVARLFCPMMQPSETVVIEGAKQYADYEGYGSSFRWLRREVDEPMAKPHTSVCMDALDFSSWSGSDPAEQYTKNSIDRELLKAFGGFTGAKCVVTGNWGGGCFKGDAILKAQIQWMAASEAGVGATYYYCYENDGGLYAQIEAMVEKFKECSVGELYGAVTRKRKA